MENIIEGLQQELVRCRELKKAYEEIGPAGAFGLHFIKQAIKDGEESLYNMDTVAMIRSYNELKEMN